MSPSSHRAQLILGAVFIAVIGITIWLFAAAGDGSSGMGGGSSSPADLTPQSGPAGGLEACVSQEVFDTSNNHDLSGFKFQGLAETADRDGLGAFANWSGKDDEDLPDSRQVDFLFMQDADTARAAVREARDQLLKGSSFVGSAPLIAESYGNLMMFYAADLRKEQRQVLDGCLRDAGVTVDAGAAAPLLTDAQAAKITKLQKDRDRANARAPQVLADAFFKGSGACIVGTPDTAGALSGMGYALVDPTMGFEAIAPNATEIAAAQQGQTMGMRRSPEDSSSTDYSGEERLGGWDRIFLATEEQASALEPKAVAEVEQAWPDGSVERAGSVLTLYTAKIDEATRAAVRRCDQQGQAAVDQILRDTAPTE